MTPAKLNTKEHILAEARKLFAKKGFDGTSMSDIAEKVGVEKASLYYFFKNKEDLFGALAEQNWEYLARELKENKNLSEEKITKKSFTDYLVKIIKNNVEAGLSVLNFNICIATSAGNYEHALEHQAYMIKRMRGFLKKEKIKNLEFAENLIVNAIHGYVIRAQFDKPSVSPEQFGKYLTDLIFNKNKF